MAKTNKFFDEDEEDGNMGHNSGDVGGIAGKRLLSIIERIERLEEEKKGLSDDIKDIYTEAKGTGFDAKTIKRIIKDRKKDKEKLEEEESLYELYKSALGML